MASRARRSTSQTSGPGRPSRTATARTNATSATSGPLLPAWIWATCQALAGNCAASTSTRSADGAPGTSRTRVNGPPFFPVAGGTPVAGRSAQTRTLWGTSMKYASPASAMRSSRTGVFPKCSSPVTHRNGSAPRARSPATIAQASAVRVWKRVSAGTPQRTRRAR